MTTFYEFQRQRPLGRVYEAGLLEPGSGVSASPSVLSASASFPCPLLGMSRRISAVRSLSARLSNAPGSPVSTRLMSAYLCGIVRSRSQAAAVHCGGLWIVFVSLIGLPLRSVFWVTTVSMASSAAAATIRER